jgi:HTH-type transcriptional regulator/antitoxin HigA
LFTHRNDIPALLHPIRNEKEYNKALLTLESLLDEDKKEDEGIIIALSILVEEYEKKHYEIESPDPIEALKYMMYEMDLSQKDLTQYVGSKSLVSQILNRKRKLSITNIRVLSAALNIPIEILVQDYSLEDEPIQEQAC